MHVSRILLVFCTLFVLMHRKVGLVLGCVLGHWTFLVIFSIQL